MIFAGGSEVAVIEDPACSRWCAPTTQPRWRTCSRPSLRGAFAPAEAQQASNGGSNPRFGPIFDSSIAGDLPPAAVRSCAVVTDRPELAAAVTAALDARDVRCTIVAVDDRETGFNDAADALASTVERAGPLDAVVVALAGAPSAGRATSAWERVLAEHAGIVDHIHADAGWARAVADYAVGPTARSGW